MNRVCTICARGGSKGVPGKNLRPLLGIPLISHSIRQAFETGLFSHVAVSSDDQEILDVARMEGAVAVRRPADLAGDLSPKLPAILHAVNAVEDMSKLNFSTIVDLDATSPLRSIQDIVGAVNLLELHKLDSVFTATEARRSPYFNQVRRNRGKRWGVVIERGPEIFRRQDAPKVYDMNASVYVWKREEFVREPALFYQSTQMFEMPQERSLDVDSETDFRIVAFLMSERQQPEPGGQ